MFEFRGVETGVYSVAVLRDARSLGLGSFHLGVVGNPGKVKTPDICRSS